MKVNTFSRTPGTSSFLFCIGLFFTALFISVFACSAIYYAVRADRGDSNKEMVKQPVVKQQPILASILK